MQTAPEGRPAESRVLAAVETTDDLAPLRRTPSAGAVARLREYEKVRIDLKSIDKHRVPGQAPKQAQRKTLFDSVQRKPVECAVCTTRDGARIAHQVASLSST